MSTAASFLAIMKYTVMCWAGLVAGMMTATHVLGVEEALEKGLYFVRLWSDETSRRERFIADSENAFQSVDLFSAQKTDQWLKESTPLLDAADAVPPLPVELEAGFMDTEADYTHELKIGNKIEKARLLPLRDFMIEDIAIDVDDDGIPRSITMKGSASLLASRATVLAVLKDRRVLGNVRGWQRAGGRKKISSIHFSLDGMSEAEVLELFLKLRQQFLFPRLSGIDHLPQREKERLMIDLADH